MRAMAAAAGMPEPIQAPKIPEAKHVAMLSPPGNRDVQILAELYADLTSPAFMAVYPMSRKRGTAVNSKVVAQIKV